MSDEQVTVNSVKLIEPSSAVSQATSALGAITQFTFGFKITPPPRHFNMIGTLKVYSRMYALKVRRSLRRHRSRQVLSAMRNAWVVTLNSPRNGLFAHLTWCLAIWARAEASGSRVSIRAVSPQYGRTDTAVDWFKTLFLNRSPVFRKDDKLGLMLAEYEEWPDYERGAGLSSLAEASALFKKYGGVQPSLLADVDHFCARHWGSAPVLGVHYRGTDKNVEAPHVPAETMIGHVRRALSLWPELRIVFVATDEASFPASLSRAFPGHRIVFVEDTLRSGNGRAVHHLMTPDGLKRAREAVFDCLVLSRTSLLLKTASMLSGWSAILTPDLPTILVNPPFSQANFFPDCELRGRICDLPDCVVTARSNYLAASSPPPVT